MVIFLKTKQSHTDYNTSVMEMESRDHSNGVSPKNQRSRYKLFFLFGFITLFGFNSIAQDVILKLDGSEINAKVLEITDQQIKYKDFDFQNGPTRNVNISDVFMITYENGGKEIFNKQVPAPTTFEKEIFDKQTPMLTNLEKTCSTFSNDLKSEFYRIGANDDEMLIFFRENNFSKYCNRFESACNQRQAGKTLLGFGIGFTVGGIAFVTAGTIRYAYVYADINTSSNDFLTYMTVGYSLMGVGQILTIISIPVSASAGGKKRAIKNDFAREQFGVTGYSYQPKLNFGTSSNGIGLTLNF